MFKLLSHILEAPWWDPAQQAREFLAWLFHYYNFEL